MWFTSSVTLKQGILWKPIRSKQLCEMGKWGFSRNLLQMLDQIISLEDVISCTSRKGLYIHLLTEKSNIPHKIAKLKDKLRKRKFKSK